MSGETKKNNKKEHQYQATSFYHFSYFGIDLIVLICGYINL